MILVDSSVWIDHFRGAITPETIKLDHVLKVDSVLVGDFVLMEVLQGCRDDHQFHRVLLLLESLLVVDLGGRGIAVQAARNYRTLRTLGITIRKTIDTVIATHCIENSHALLYRDRDFDPFVRYLGLRSAMP